MVSGFEWVLLSLSTLFVFALGYLFGANRAKPIDDPWEVRNDDLDRLAFQYGIVRMANEYDPALRRRILTHLNGDL